MTKRHMKKLEARIVRALKKKIANEFRKLQNGKTVKPQMVPRVFGQKE